MSNYTQNNKNGDNNMSFHTNAGDSASEPDVSQSKRFDLKAKVVTILLTVGTLAVAILTFVYTFILK
jgi:hypothetical protein